ncbi:unnamed protein product [Adineta steineri]|uniref:Uncharacterized protein n=1 Tax=Adineta steineri TaxID=433720 RepID=A0A813PMA7_9BILA|nr:unnamed protein product [Adineta steineri]
MATSKNKIQCFVCNKEKNTYSCKGCSNEFCFPHLKEHRQRIETQLEEIINDHDQFQQTIIQQKQNPDISPLIDQINQWETNSIHQIQLTAQQCREKVMKSTQKNNNDMEKKFIELSKKLKEIREENEFNEIDLNHFQLKLTQITEEFLQLSNISIRQDLHELIKKTSVKISLFAQQCRETAMKLTQKSINDVEKKFIELSQKLKEIRQENEFNEIDLNHFQLKLTQITKELFTLPSISIEGDSQEFINKISVHSAVEELQTKKNKFQQFGITVAGGNGQDVGVDESVGAQHLADVLQHNTTLTTLDFQWNGIGDVGAQHLANVLKHNSTLTTLNLEHNSIGDVGAQHLANGLRHNTTLTTLDLGRNEIGAVGAQHMGDALRLNITLITLNLHHNSIGDDGAQHLADGLRYNTTLTTINLGDNKIGDVGAQHLADGLRHNTTLITLNLEDNQIGAVGAQYLADGLRHNTTLITLNLDANQIEAFGAQHLADVLKHSTTLIILNLQRNQIGDVGAQHFADVLRHNTTLTTLNLRGNEIGDVGVQYLTDELRYNTTLTTLDLQSNEFGTVALQHLADVLRHNTVISSLYSCIPCVYLYFFI